MALTSDNGLLVDGITCQQYVLEERGHVVRDEAREWARRAKLALHNLF